MQNAHWYLLLWCCDVAVRTSELCGPSNELSVYLLGSKHPKQVMIEGEFRVKGNTSPTNDTEGCATIKTVGFAPIKSLDRHTCSSQSCHAPRRGKINNAI